MSNLRGQEPARTSARHDCGAARVVRIHPATLRAWVIGRSYLELHPNDSNRWAWSHRCGSEDSGVTFAEGRAASSILLPLATLLGLPTVLVLWLLRRRCKRFASAAAILLRGGAVSAAPAIRFRISRERSSIGTNF